LATDEEAIEQLPNEVLFKVIHITRMTDAELTQEFYDKVFGEGEVTNEEEARQRLNDYLKSTIQPRLDGKLLGELREAIIDANPVPLPDSFLKRWLALKAENQSENKAQDFLSIAEDMFQNDERYIRWQVLRARVEKDHNIEISQEELTQEAETTVRRRLRDMGYPLPEEQMQAVVDRFKNDREEMERIYTNMVEFKVLQHLKDQMSIPEQHLPWEEAQKEIQKAEAPGA
jgi:trigger factor